MAPAMRLGRMFANMRPSRIAGAMWAPDVGAGTHALSTDADAAWPQRGAQLAPTPGGKRIVQLCILAYYTSATLHTSWLGPIAQILTFVRQDL